MALSGPTRVHRWRDAATARTARIGPVVREADLPVELVVPHGDGDDHAEAVTVVGGDPHDPRARLLVVYDAPAAARRPWSDTLLADRVRIGDGVVDEPAASVPEAEPSRSITEAEPSRSITEAEPTAIAEAEPTAPITGAEWAAAAPVVEPAEPDDTAPDRTSDTDDTAVEFDDTGVGSADAEGESSDVPVPAAPEPAADADLAAPDPAAPDPAAPDPAHPEPAAPEHAASNPAADADPVVHGARGVDGHRGGAAPASHPDALHEATADGRAQRPAPPQPAADDVQPESAATATDPRHRAVSASANTSGRSR
jgi:hypothetical protein